MLTIKKPNFDKVNFLYSAVEEYIKVDELNEIKNYSLYTSLNKGEFKTPKEIISDKDLERISFRAHTRYNIAKGVINICWTHLDEIKKHLRETGINKPSEDIFEQFQKRIGL